MLEFGGQAGSASDDLGAAIGQLMGDHTEETIAPENQGDGTDAGAPPAVAPPATPESSPTPVEAPDGEPPVEGSAPAPATPDVAPPVDDDPLASSVPLRYTVNGQERAIEGIRILGDEAIITKDALPDVVRRLGERDNLFEQRQQWHQQTRQSEALAAWVTTAPDGSEQMLTGNAGLVEMRVSHARLEAALGTLLGALQDPAQLPNLVALDEAGQIVLNNPFVQDLLTRSELSEIKAEQQALGIIGQIRHQANAHSAPPPDYSRFAPDVIRMAAGDQASVLSPADQKVLGQQMLRYIRPTTADERRNGHGAEIVDGEFTAAVQYLVALRSEGATAAKVAVAATTSNAAKLAAARMGAPARPQITRSVAPASAARPDKSDQDLAWEARERAAAGRSRR